MRGCLGSLSTVLIEGRGGERLDFVFSVSLRGVPPADLVAPLSSIGIICLEPATERRDAAMLAPSPPFEFSESEFSMSSLPVDRRGNKGVCFGDGGWKRGNTASSKTRAFSPGMFSLWLFGLQLLLPLATVTPSLATPTVVWRRHPVFFARGMPTLLLRKQPLELVGALRRTHFVPELDMAAETPLIQDELVLYLLGTGERNILRRTALDFSPRHGISSCTGPSDQRLHLVPPFVDSLDHLALPLVNELFATEAPFVAPARVVALIVQRLAFETSDLVAGADDFQTQVANAFARRDVDSDKASFTDNFSMPATPHAAAIVADAIDAVGIGFSSPERRHAYGKCG